MISAGIVTLFKDDEVTQLFIHWKINVTIWNFHVYGNMRAYNVSMLNSFARCNFLPFSWACHQRTRKYKLLKSPLCDNLPLDLSVAALTLTIPVVRVCVCGGFSGVLPGVILWSWIGCCVGGCVLLVYQQTPVQTKLHITYACTSTYCMFMLGTCQLRQPCILECVALCIKWYPSPRPWVGYD